MLYSIKICSLGAVQVIHNKCCLFTLFTLKTSWLQYQYPTCHWNIFTVFVLSNHVNILCYEHLLLFFLNINIKIRKNVNIIESFNLIPHCNLSQICKPSQLVFKGNEASPSSFSCRCFNSELQSIYTLIKLLWSYFSRISNAIYKFLAAQSFSI